MTREEKSNLLNELLEYEEKNDIGLLTRADRREFQQWISNALEQEPTTKNDLGVDWESYKDVDGNSLDDLILEVLQNNFDCGNTYGYKVADEIIGLLPSVTPQEPKSEWEQDHAILKAYSDGADEVLDKLRAEIAEYGSIMVSYAITKDTKTDKGIEKLVSGVLKQAKEQVLEIIDKYKTEIEPQESEEV